MAPVDAHGAGVAARSDKPLYPEVRPFYFIVVLWGARFRDYFLDLCLPSVLSPNNIPALSNGGGNKFLICTTRDDWEAMVPTPIFALMRRYMEPVFIEIPLPPAGRSGVEHMGAGHVKATELAFRDKAYGALLTPDCIISDGAVAAMQRHAAAGKRLVLFTAFRFTEEPLFAALQEFGILDPGARLSERGAPLVASGRQMVAAGLRSLHPEFQRYGWESNCFSDFPPGCWWPVPGEDGIVIHSMSWGSLLMDFGSLARHDTTSLETRSFDEDYLYRNFGADLADIHVVTDSDELMHMSWTPSAERPIDLTPIPSHAWPIAGELIKGGILRRTINNQFFEPLKRRLIFITVRWHARALSPAWQDVEARARARLQFYLFGLDHAERRVTGFIVIYPLLRALDGMRHVASLIWAQLRHTDRIIEMLGRGLRGDRAAWGRINQRVRLFLNQLIGRRPRRPPARDPHVTARRPE